MISDYWGGISLCYERYSFEHGCGDKLPRLEGYELPGSAYSLHDGEYSSCERNCRKRWFMELSIDHELEMAVL